jgi:hypothetical protein
MGSPGRSQDTRSEGRLKAVCARIATILKSRPAGRIEAFREFLDDESQATRGDRERTVEIDHQE